MICIAEKKDYKIEYDTQTKIFKVFDREGDIIKETISEDALEKFLSGAEQKEKDKKTEKKNFKKIGAFQSNYDEWVFGMVTSIAVESNYRNDIQVWFTNTDKERSKELASDLYIDTAKNREIRTKIDGIVKQKRELEDLINMTRKEMITIKDDILFKKNIITTSS